MPLHHTYHEVWDLLAQDRLRGVFADGEDLTFLPMWDLLMSMVSFRDSDLRFAHFRDTEVTLGFFERANMGELFAERTHFRHCMFDRVMWGGASFTDCSFYGCSIRKPAGQASFTDCRFENSVLERVPTFEPHAVLRSSVQLQGPHNL